jgi:hypothetical protein
VVLGGPAQRLQAEGDRRGQSAQGMAGTAIDMRASFITASGQGMQMFGGATPVVLLADPDHYRRPQFALSKSLPQLGERQQGHVEPHFKWGVRATAPSLTEEGAPYDIAHTPALSHVQAYASLVDRDAAPGGRGVRTRLPATPALVSPIQRAADFHSSEASYSMVPSAA